MDGRFRVNRVEPAMMIKEDESFELPPFTNNTSIQELGISPNTVEQLRRLSRGDHQIDVASTICLPDLPNRRRRSLAQMTREALPRLDFYRNSKRALRRPSLGELHGEETKDTAVELSDGKGSGQAPAGGGHVGIKLGWIQGVLIPCLLNIWGVMLFLRLSWIVAQAGIGCSLIIIAISAAVCIITTLSLSAISTNGEVKGGGIYYIISRSLGPEFGASVGIVFAFANAVAASMNTIGFCNALNDLLAEYDLKIVDGGVNDVRIVGIIAILVMVVICAVGMEWESKAQNFLVAIICAAIVDFVVGTIIGPTNDEQKSKGFKGLSLEVFEANWLPDYRMQENIQYDFFSVFAIFFPSVTGIQAGANISGDLKDPASSIPKGTLLALLISMFSYILFVFLAGGAALRDASGLYINGTMIECVGKCDYGLHNSYSMMIIMSSWGPIINAGCFAATLSTALTNLLSVPRLIQALGIDRIYPGLIFFSKGYGKAGEPYRGYVLTFLVAAVFLLIADLNMIAPLISNFYLASYGLINFCTFHAALIKPLGWRPTFKYYNTWLSLAGFVMCVVIMFLIDWVASLITFIIIFALYLIVVYRKPDVNWGSSTQAQTYKTALTTALRLTTISEHVKNYRPQILVLCGKPCARPPLVDLANLITRNNSLLVCGEISQKRLSHRSRSNRLRSGYSWLKQRKIKAFYTIVDGMGMEVGAKSLQQSVGIGKLCPNVLMMGYKNDWKTCNPEELLAYFNILHNAFDNRLSVTIVRLEGGLDFSNITDEDESLTTSADMTVTGTHTLNPSPRPLRATTAHMMHADSNLNIATVQDMSVTENGSTKVSTIGSLTKNGRPRGRTSVQQILYKTGKRPPGSIPGGDEIPRALFERMSVFQRGKRTGTSGKDDSSPTGNSPKGTIDVWWMYDDGGLTMLLPYIVSTRTDWNDCRLRVFALANRKQELELEERNMANLLSKFRIDYSSLQMVSDIMEKPKESTVAFFNSLLEPFKETEGSQNECRVSDIELATLQEKTNRQLRLRELLLENSKNAALVVMSLPMPRKGSVSAPLYMAWLEVLTKDLPPYVLVRGNQTSVLTFYS